MDASARPVKTLLVNNDSDTWTELSQLVVSNGLDVTETHVLTLRPETADGFDLVILSGGYWYDDSSQHMQTYQHELDLIRRTSVPILGICVGMQLLQVAYSGEVPLLAAPQTGVRPIQVLPQGQADLGLPVEIDVFKNHTRGVRSVAAGFEVLANSKDNAEIIRHERQPLLGMQFHPEIGDEPGRSTLFMQLVRHVMQLKQRD